MLIKTASELNEIIKEIFLAAGAGKKNADRVAASLVSAHLSGVDTHGIRFIPLYLEQIKSGELIPDACPEIIKETKNTALIKGNYTFGQVTAAFAMDIAIKKALKHSTSVVSGVQVTHTGRIGEYVEMAAKRKMISFLFTGGLSEEGPIAVPYGGSKRALHTNPFAIGFPMINNETIVIDIATTSISGVKIQIAKEKKSYLPKGCIVDKNGNPTCNPDDFYDGGALLPFGGHKGYALMFANEILGRIFANTADYFKTDKGGKVWKHSGFTIIVFKADLFNTLNVTAQ